MSKMKLSCHDQLDRVWFVTKTSKDNNMIDRIGAFYVFIMLNCRNRLDQVPTLMKTK